VRKAGVADFGSSKIEIAKVGQFSDVPQAVVRYVGSAKHEALEFFQSGELGHARGVEVVCSGKSKFSEFG
jgi:hypothetical protein